MTSSRKLRGTSCLQMLCLLCLPALPAHGLPEDREQDIVIEYSRLETFLDEGVTIAYGKPDEPAVVTQGSMVISGQEIRVEGEENELRRITATGSPARFQQQPALDKAVVHASAGTIVFDNQRRFLSLEDGAELIQEGTGTFKASRIEYDLEAARLNAGGAEGGGASLIIPPAGDAP